MAFSKRCCQNSKSSPSPQPSPRKLGEGDSRQGSSYSLSGSQSPTYQRQGPFEKRGLSGDAHHPTLQVSTRDLGEAVEVRVRGNSTGIAPEIRDKLPAQTSEAHRLLLLQHSASSDSSSRSAQPQHGCTLAEEDPTPIVGVGSNTPPRPGSISICLRCSAISVERCPIETMVVFGRTSRSMR